jgi:hypothetical protein
VPEHLSGSPIDVLDGALRDPSTHTRRQLLKRTGVGAAGLAIGSLGAPASGALADGGNFGHGIGGARQFGTFASTTEALTVTLLTELLRRVALSSEVPSDVAAVFDGAYAAELDHWRFISHYFSPQTKQFWIPDAVFGGPGNALSLTAVGNALVAGETLFTNTYLIGVTTFAATGRSTFARYMAELAAVESEHRVLAQTLINASPPNNLGFAQFQFDRVDAIQAALEGAGFGFGKQGSSAGRFYTFPEPPMAPPIPISSNEPK